jgi:hypothetical protein
MDYGLVKECPKNLQEGDYFRSINYFVSRSGRHEQYYTLYRSNTTQLVGFWANSSHNFVKNLSFNKEKALTEVTKLIKGREIGLFFTETPQKEYTKFEAFGLIWKEGKKALYAFPDYAFWDN